MRRVFLLSTPLPDGRAAAAAALVWFLCAPRGTTQSFLGDCTGYSVAGRTVTVTSGAASVRLTPCAPEILRVDFLPTPASVPDSSRRIGSGLYLCRLEAGGFAGAIKVLLGR